MSTPSGLQLHLIHVIGASGRNRDGPPAELRAYAANNVSEELYDRNQAGIRDEAGPSVKFAVPTIALGRVYIGTQTELDVYGVFTSFLHGFRR